ncbi:MAG: ATPase, T2SS/T4P/T4SS family [Candidatus Latescibacterota bacterium]
METILIVDDEWEVAEILSGVVENMGKHAITASNGREGLEEFRKHQVDLVITDMNMPEMDGNELLKAIKRIDKNAVVITVTGDPSIDTALDSVRNGAYDYLIKPLHVAQIEVVIERALERKGLTKKLASFNRLLIVYLKVEGIVDDETVERAIAIQQGEAERGGPKGTQWRRIADILVEDLGVDRHAVYKTLSELYGFRETSLTPKTIKKKCLDAIHSLIERLPDDLRAYMVHKRVIPFVENLNADEKLQILAADPTDPLLEALAARLGYRRYEVTYVRKEVLEELLELIAPAKNEFLERIEEAAGETQMMEADAGVDEEALDAEINQSLLGNLVEGCLVEAVRRGVSDIHIVPKEGNRTEFHFREDGKLYLWYAHEGTKPEAISAVLKDRTVGADRFEREKAQDGFIQRRIDDHVLRFRVSVMPIVGLEFGRNLERIVIRIVDDRKVITDLGKLGLSGKTQEAFLQAIRKPQGIVILTGPTGSGKSTTLVAALHYVMNPAVNVLTVEDPVEYMIPGAGQLRIKEDKMSFDQAMRSILRHDPDIVMVGEIRDLETAQIAIKLANTGHLTFSTLHTNDAPSAVSRLFKMGIEPFLIASAINIVVAQRLIPTLCPRCKRPIGDLDPAVPLSLGFTPEEIETTTFYEAVGCEACRMLGYKGRAGIHEALVFTKEIRRLILKAGDVVDEDAIRDQAIAQGMVTLRASGRARIQEGITTFAAVAAETTE